MSETRWVPSRKAAVIKAVRQGTVALDDLGRLYGLSIEEYRAWEQAFDRYGVPGLRSTRTQIYRQTEPKRGTAREALSHPRAACPGAAFDP
jgi:hypothetical protein